SSGYVACFLDATSEEVLATTNDEAPMSFNGKVTQCFNSFIEDSSKHILIGPTSSSWPFSAIQTFLEKNKLLPKQGSELGERLIKINDYLQTFIPASEVEAVLTSLSQYNPADDQEHFQKELVSTLKEWGKEGYAEELEAGDVGAYIATLTSFLDVLRQARLKN